MEIRAKAVGCDVDASPERPSEDPSIEGNHQSFTLSPKEDRRAVRAGAASRIPRSPGMTLDLSGKGLEGICSLQDIAGQGLDMLDCLTQHLARGPRSQLRDWRPTGVRHE